MEAAFAKRDLMAALAPESGAGLLAVCLPSALLCLAERWLTFAHDRRWTPFHHDTRWTAALWRTALYWALTLLRLAYMIVAMATLTISTGYAITLVLVLVTSLATGQFFIELRDDSEPERENYNLLNSSEPMVRRPRAKSKPDAIFIHPMQSNLARADARVLELGLAQETDRVARAASPPAHNPGSWGQGQGRAAARAMLTHPPRREKVSEERRHLWNPSSPESDGYGSS
jgi:hypothetical protein